jgi:hypothetical protein
VHRQLTNEIQLRDGQRGLVLSASKELEPGARAMLLLAAGLFRLDVMVRGDSLQTTLRNLSSGPVDIERASGEGETIVLGEAASYQPGRAGLHFTVGEPGDRVEVEVTLATLRFEQRGTVRISSQAIVRQATGS